MVPPKYYRYFFSFNGTIFLDENPKSTPVKLPLPEEISYEVNKEVLLLKVEKASQRNGKAKKIANDWN